MRSRTLQPDESVKAVKRSGPSELRTRLAGPVRVGEILDVVATFDKPVDVDAQIAKIYDWRHTRGLSALQLAFAPAAVAVATLVSQGATTWVFVVAGVLLLVSLVVGLWRLARVNMLHCEYLIALRLGKALAPFHVELAAHVRELWFDHTPPEFADRGSRQPVGAVLYDELGELTMLQYRSSSDTQQVVRQVLEKARLAAAPPA